MISGFTSRATACRVVHARPESRTRTLTFGRPRDVHFTNRTFEAHRRNRTGDPSLPGTCDATSPGGLRSLCCAERARLRGRLRLPLRVAAKRSWGAVFRNATGPGVRLGAGSGAGRSVVVRTQSEIPVTRPARPRRGTRGANGLDSSDGSGDPHTGSNATRGRSNAGSGWIARWS